MRVLLAGLFFWIGMMAVVVVLFEIPAREPPVWIIAPVAVVSNFVLLVVAWVLFNPSGHRALPDRAGDFVQRLEEKGLLAEENFEATRAFRIVEFEDEGSHYMVELSSGSVLYLTGQCLYDYEPIVDDPEFNQPREFPNTSFTVRRHKTEGYIVEIKCRGEVLEPECTAPHFDQQDFEQGFAPEDGQVISDRSYDELKIERMK